MQPRMRCSGDPGLSQGQNAHATRDHAPALLITQPNHCRPSGRLQEYTYIKTCYMLWRLLRTLRQGMPCQHGDSMALDVNLQHMQESRFPDAGSWLQCVATHACGAGTPSRSCIYAYVCCAAQENTTRCMACCTSDFRKCTTAIPIASQRDC